MSLKVVLVFVCLNLVFNNVLVRSDEQIVKTSSGSVKGLTVRVFNQSIGQFLGIPFAEPPIGSLRFAKPKPISKPIEGIIDATKPKYSCIQSQNPSTSDSSLSEDCLTLNIWSQKREDNNSTKLKPVMFWIYGGGLRRGSIFETKYNGSVLATHDIVFVSVNYRLGYLGFLYGGEESAPGNVGFFDQLLGLKWVRENIHLFGGDKNQITIFGQSAGSWSVSAHVLSPLSRGLFKRAIMESGAHIFNKDRPLFSKEEGLQKAKQLAKRVNCTEDKQWLECLRKVDANKLIYEQIVPSFPVDETQFIPISAQKAFTQLNYNRDIDLIAGVTRNEGSILSLTLSLLKMLKGDINEKQFEDLVTFTDTIYHNINVTNFLEFYLHNIDRKNTSALKRAFYDFYGDIEIKCPTYHFAKQFAKHSPNRKTFFYELTYEDKSGVCDEKTMGICHGSDIEYVFGKPLVDKNQSSDLDIDFSRNVMKMWTNFAKNGDPGANWPQMLDHDSAIVKNLNPRDVNGVFVDPLKNDCDGLWKNYFN